MQVVRDRVGRRRRWSRRRRLNSVGADHVDRQHDLVAGLGEQPAAGVDLVGLQQRAADAVALGGEEREAHAAADQQPVDLGQQRLDDGQLVADLRAAEHDDVGPLGVGGQPGEHLELAGDQPAGVVRQPLGHVVDRGVLAVHGAERVVDVDVGEGGQPVGQLAALGVVLRRLGRLEADVLQQQDVAVAERGRLGRRVVAGDVGGQRHRRRRAARPAARRPARGSTAGRARPWAGRGARRRSPARRRPGAPAGWAGWPGSGRRR